MLDTLLTGNWCLLLWCIAQQCYETVFPLTAKGIYVCYFRPVKKLRFLRWESVQHAALILRIKIPLNLSGFGIAVIRYPNGECTFTSTDEWSDELTSGRVEHSKRSSGKLVNTRSSRETGWLCLFRWVGNVHSWNRLTLLFRWVLKFCSVETGWLCLFRLVGNVLSCVKSLLSINYLCAFPSTHVSDD